MHRVTNGILVEAVLEVLSETPDTIALLTRISATMRTLVATERHREGLETPRMRRVVATSIAGMAGALAGAFSADPPPAARQK